MYIVWLKTDLENEEHFVGHISGLDSIEITMTEKTDRELQWLAI